MNDRDAWSQWIKDVTVRVKVPKVPKYRAHRVTVDGIAFDSKREADRYQELKLMEAAGAIQALQVHPSFPLQVVALHLDGPPWEIETIGMYTADFRYVDRKTGEVVIEDVKTIPTKTTAYKLRKRIAEVVHGITITEVS
jgi:Protein of unknown function (DUF1064)